MERPNPNEAPGNGMLSSAVDEVSIFDVLTALARHWRMIVGVPFLVAVITAVMTLSMPNFYTARTMILLGEDDGAGMMSAMMAQMGGLAGLAGGLVGGASKGELYVTMLKSESIKDPLVDRYQLMQKFQAKYRAQAYGVLDSLSSIKADKNNGVITIAVDNEDPKLAAALANSYVEELGKLAARLNMTGAGKNRTYLEGNLSKAKADLAAAEDALKAFQTRNNAVSVTDQAKATLEGVADLRAQLIAQEIQLSTLRRQFTDESQEVKAGRATIANMRRQIALLESGASSGSLPGVGAMPELGQEYMRLMRQFKIQETLVELLTKQYELNRLNESKDLAPFQVLQEAKVPELKSKPKRSVIVVLAALATGLLMVLLAFVREYATRMSDEERKRWQELLKLLPLPSFVTRSRADRTQ